MGISGKCDFEDTISIWSPEEILAKYKIYAYGHDLVPLWFQTPKDLVPYYPYLVITMGAEKNKGGIIHLSSESFIDREEQEQLGSMLQRVQKYWRKCKRNKVPFDKEEALRLCAYNMPPESYEGEIVDRVAELGNKATIDGIHDGYHDRMRNELYKLMLEYGWGEDESYRWVYGWDRWLKKTKMEKYGERGAQMRLNLDDSND